MKIQNFALVGVLALAACVSSSPEQKASEQLVTKAGAIDVTYTNPAVKESAVGFRSVGVNVVSVEKSGGGGSSTSVRVVKANCALKGDGYSATFSTPAQVNLPSHGPATKPVTLTCEHNGKPYTETFKARNLSAEQRAGAAAGTALVCIPCAIGQGVAGAGAQEGDVYGFSSIQLKL